MTKHGSNQSASDSSADASGAFLTAEPLTGRDERAPVDEQIRLRAYELYLERGAQPNDDLGDWLQAEREYRERSRDERGGETWQASPAH